MCLIVTLIMFALSIQNLLNSHFLVGAVQLILSFGFLALLIHNIRRAKCDREGKGCDTCALPSWLSTLFKKEKN